jgi:hypothetical protein
MVLKTKNGKLDFKEGQVILIYISEIGFGKKSILKSFNKKYV